MFNCEKNVLTLLVIIKNLGACFTLSCYIKFLLTLFQNETVLAIGSLALNSQVPTLGGQRRTVHCFTSQPTVQGLSSKGPFEYWFRLIVERLTVFLKRILKQS